jgi:hypothetical protein
MIGPSSQRAQSLCSRGRSFCTPSGKDWHRDDCLIFAITTILSSFVLFSFSLWRVAGNQPLALTPESPSQMPVACRGLYCLVPQQTALGWFSSARRQGPRTITVDVAAGSAQRHTCTGVKLRSSSALHRAFHRRVDCIKEASRQPGHELERRKHHEHPCAPRDIVRIPASGDDEDNGRSDPPYNSNKQRYIKSVMLGPNVRVRMLCRACVFGPWDRNSEATSPGSTACETRALLGGPLPAS